MNICPTRGHILAARTSWKLARWHRRWSGSSGRQRRVVLTPAQERAMSKQTEPSIAFVHGMITDAITAVVINAQAGLQLLRAQSPDLEKVRQTLNNIANDGKRAGDIVVRTRAHMKKVAAADDAADPWADNLDEWPL